MYIRFWYTTVKTFIDERFFFITYDYYTDRGTDFRNSFYFNYKIGYRIRLERKISM